MLLKICQSNLAPIREQKEADVMRKEIFELKNTIYFLDRNIETLGNLISTCSLEEDLSSEECPASFCSDNFSTSLIDLSNVQDQDLLLNDGQELNADHDSFSAVVKRSHDTLVSDMIDHSGFPDIDCDNINYSGSDDEKKEIIMSEKESLPMIEKLYECMGVLPRHAQENIIDDLERMVTNPSFVKEPMDTACLLAQLSTNMITQNVNNIKETKPSEDDSTKEAMMKLTSTVLAAFLAQDRAESITASLQSKETHTALPIHA